MNIKSAATNFVTLDLGTTMGVCIHADNDVDSYSIQLAKLRDLPHRRFEGLKHHLDLIISKFPALTTVIYEKVIAHKGSAAAHCYGGFEAILLMWAHKHNLEVIPYSPCEIKKSFTGSGKSTKEQMRRKAEEKYYEVADDNEADALAMMNLYLCNMKIKNESIVNE